jgi:hypothetical protein
MTLGPTRTPELRRGLLPNAAHSSHTMSEYQYYEFQAIDRPLSREEIQTLRGYSTRARITTTSFTDEYSFGSFKGDADKWMAKYFDAFEAGEDLR